MLNEFIYGHHIYLIRKELNVEATDEEVVLFKDLDGAQAFFRAVAKDRFAREDLMEVAKWIGINNVKSANHQDVEMVEQTFERLCLKIWVGELLLVEIKPAKVIDFEKCCRDAINAINQILEASKILNKTLLGSKLVLLFFSRSKGKKLVGMVSMIKDFSPTSPTSNDWMLLAKAMMAVPDMARRSVREIAGQEAVRHEVDNKRELYTFWKGTFDAFA